MLCNWSWFMPEFINSGEGIFGLGPYFNVLPIVTVVLFLVTQKMSMPAPTNEQAVMQQKMMKYMTIFMGLLFYKVASGLCLYFIASSLWGIAERKLLKKKPARLVPGGDGDRRPQRQTTPATPRPAQRSRKRNGKSIGSTGEQDRPLENVKASNRATRVLRSHTTRSPRSPLPPAAPPAAWSASAAPSQRCRTLSRKRG